LRVSGSVAHTQNAVLQYIWIGSKDGRTMTNQEARKDKRSAALSSVIAAVGLTTFKLIVGLLTNSLGILAEAAHSGLDLVAAATTYFAVRASDKPADEEHPFGHGKIENLSALFETVLLLATSGWIIYEAIQRLFFISVKVEASIWSFIVMGTSIVIDYTRSRILYRAARKYKSQALEADALHFSTDIWSSSVVILGLIGIAIASRSAGLDWLHKADSVAALVVAVIVIYVSGELGWRTVSALLDTAPRGLADKIEHVAAGVPGVVDAHAIRIRPSGAHTFIDMHVTMDGDLTLNDAHAATEVIEHAILKVISPADVTVHVEPADVPPKLVPSKAGRKNGSPKRPRGDGNPPPAPGD
jgi:cation diffusion facilitator family transporter